MTNPPLELNTRTETILITEEEDSLSSPGCEVVEVPLLLSSRQMVALEEAAHHRGLTAGEMVRRVLQDFIAAPAAGKSACTMA
jgi:hypothetical protein